MKNEKTALARTRRVLHFLRKVQYRESRVA